MSEEKQPEPIVTPELAIKTDESARQATWLDSPTVVVGRPTSNQIRSEPQFKELPPEREVLEDMRLKQAETNAKLDAVLAAKPAERGQPKRQRRRKTKPPTARDLAICSLPSPSRMGLEEYCTAMTNKGQTLRSSWPRPNGEKTYADAYKWHDEELIEKIESERKNAWNRRNRR